MKKIKSLSIISVLSMMTLCGCHLKHEYDLESPFKKNKNALAVAEPGIAYKQSVDVALCKYGYGDPDWDKDNQEWLDSNDNESYPDELKEVDGDAYHDSREAATDPNALAVYGDPGSAYEDAIESVFLDDDYDDYGDYDPRPS